MKKSHMWAEITKINDFLWQFTRSLGISYGTARQKPGLLEKITYFFYIKNDLLDFDYKSVSYVQDINCLFIPLRRPLIVDEAYFKRNFTNYASKF